MKDSTTTKEREMQDRPAIELPEGYALVWYEEVSEWAVEHHGHERGVETAEHIVGLEREGAAWTLADYDPFYATIQQDIDEAIYEHERVACQMDENEE